jgi:hypothetical protein
LDGQLGRLGLPGSGYDPKIFCSSHATTTPRNTLGFIEDGRVRWEKRDGYDANDISKLMTAEICDIVNPVYDKLSLALNVNFSNPQAGNIQL